MTTTHTPEPWLVHGGDSIMSGACDGIAGNLCRVADCELTPYAQRPKPATEEAKANAARIVACVNAMAGIANPEGNLKLARSRLYNAIERAKASGAHYKLIEEMTDSYTLMGGRL